MTALDQIRRLFEHAAWADARFRHGLGALESPPAEAVREYAHMLGAEETWLSRIDGREATAPVWPTGSFAELAVLSDRVRAGYAALLVRITNGDLARNVTYRTSAGQEFSTPLGEILTHVALHGQYHRGKVNLVLRQSGLTPAPADYIAFVRGVPAATTPRMDTPRG